MSDHTPEQIAALAEAHYVAVNLRVHGHVDPPWARLPQKNRDWYTEDMRIALMVAPLAVRAIIEKEGGKDE